MNLIQSIMTQNPCYKSGRKITVKGLMLHSVGCPQPSAEVFIRNWNKPTYNTACVHGFIDANNGNVYQCLPWNHRGWHGGGSSNNTHIGIEMCEPSCIKYTGGSSFTCSDTAKAKACVKRTYDAAVELFAYLCKEYGLNPLGDGVIVSHREGHKRGIASNHGDPEHLWNGLNMGYTMDGFRKDVYNAINGSVDFTEQAVNLYGKVIATTLNVRKMPTTSSSIIGQHTAGDEVIISAKTSNGWYRVEYPEIGTGYLYAEYVETVNLDTPKPEPTPPVEEVVDNGVDNSPDEWAIDAVQSALDKGILFGDDKGNLKLHTNCTRQDVIVFLHRLYKNMT